MDMCLFIPILVGVVCALLGYLLGNLSGDGSNRYNAVDVYKNRISILETELAACKERLGNTKVVGNGISSGAGNSGARSSMMAAGNTAEPTSSRENTTESFNAAAAKAAFGKKIAPDDLTVVEGIGPKIKALFHNHDVQTWAALAACSVDKCQEVLRIGGKRYEIHKPGTWPEQAKLATQGKWQELKDWQDTLKGGK